VYEWAALFAFFPYVPHPLTELCILSTDFQAVGTLGLGVGAMLDFGWHCMQRPPNWATVSVILLVVLLKFQDVLNVFWSMKYPGVLAPL
jgi:hypothetical protein